MKISTSELLNSGFSFYPGQYRFKYSTIPTSSASPPLVTVQYQRSRHHTSLKFITIHHYLFLVRLYRDDGESDYLDHHNDGGDTESVLQLLVDIAQDTAGGIQYVPDDEFREQPVRRHGRVQLCEQIKTNPLI